MKKKALFWIIIVVAVLLIVVGIFLYIRMLRKRVDIVIFMGQSNIAGRGVTSEQWTETAPAVTEGAGWEYRAISDPSKLYPIEEPFGVYENLNGYIDDGTKKTGSLVSSFINAYYAGNGKVPTVAISASKGGTSIAGWSGNGLYLVDALIRLKSAQDFLAQSDRRVRHTYAVWCQGETDADIHTSKEEYVSRFTDMVSRLKEAGVEKVFMISIGHINDDSQRDLYEEMIAWQAELAAQNPDVVMVSDDFVTMRERGLMKDTFHYYQAGYNECGEIAGKNAALYACGRRTGALH